MAGSGAKVEATLLRIIVPNEDEHNMKYEKKCESFTKTKSNQTNGSSLYVSGSESDALTVKYISSNNDYYGAVDLFSYSDNSLDSLIPGKVCKQRVVDVYEQHSVMYKLGTFTIPFVMLSYTALQLAVGYYNSHYEVCSEPYHLHPYVRYVHLGTVAWFACHISYNICQISCNSGWQKSETLYAHVHGLCVMLIVESSAVLSVLPNTTWTPLCRDTFGVVSRVAQWPEWIISVPLCVFIALSCKNDQQSLTKFDILMVFLMFVVVVSGFLLNWNFASLAINASLLGVSCASLTSIVFLAVNLTSCVKSKQLETGTEGSSSSTALSGRRIRSLSLSQTHTWLKKLIRQVYQINLAHKKKNLCMVCVFGLPLFPVIYFLSAYRVISDEWTVALFSIASLLFKSVLVGVLVAGHSKMYEDMRVQAEAVALEIELL